MFRKAFLQVAVLAALVLGGAAGSAAVAQAQPTFVAASYPATIDSTALQTTVFGFAIYAWECKSQSYQGSLAAETTELTLAPTYSECRWQYPPGFPFSVVQVSMNECKYKLHGLKRVAASEYSALLDLECPTAKDMVVELHQGTETICTLTVPAQASRSHVQLVDVPAKEAPQDIRAEFTVEKLHYSQINHSSSCPVKEGTYEDMTLKGQNTLQATAGGELIPIQVIGE